jgi:hypothetical protein
MYPPSIGFYEMKRRDEKVQGKGEDIGKELHKVGRK